ncbi:TIGR02453 family protein [Flavobacterium branchiophilum]|uniref:Uncharacterized protein (TIGR02453 family) n=1 Tax=Flavobacterium branchiophilum TaxID=55197 RepID=A0A543G6W4_9FLAO|nr:DUF2461 domain-containing protein [Flavobacterium branchiophilum]OXA72783.1 TIGR02453 family protein [Flavobacterium branchiophilum] [Flavobacterium branchiophilum NBRC 15030 = ATCC 35035]TQM41819.1 uncharacterized protein (TIGR02453 family) [Flavobacterium branchiophilum]GEM56374.1 TIGR02453 family protein [Flavobacterium branchiophilum NBRC 15030 = ATCC 35035]
MTTVQLQFLEDLKHNNHKEWFHDNKKAFEHYKQGYHQMIAQVLELMKPLDTRLAPLEVKNCTFRINRDIRFAKDKSPYKTNMGFWFSTNKNRKNAPGYYVHYEKGASFLAGGVWCPEVDELKNIRKEIAFFHDDLTQITNHADFKSIYGDFDKSDAVLLKKAPKGFDPNHEAIAFLKLKSFTASTPIADDLFLDPNFASIIVPQLLVLKPLNDFLTRALTTDN